jgi:hypothetical protein
VNSRERGNDKHPEGPKTDSVISARSSNRRGSAPPSTTSSSSTAVSYAFHKAGPKTVCRNSDWRSMKRSMKELWRSVVSV